MLLNPRIGMRVRLHYAERRRCIAPYHGREGEVLIASHGPGPRNHLVLLDGGVYVIVPAGNLMKSGAKA